ncbi:MAG: helix-turn-helix transcriptional regulator [Limnohabitans sp.]|nr:helix-turn-helix transcriptional regulator [Limnohabitans sp.]
MTFAQQLKAEISRVAKRELRQEILALKKSNAQHRSQIAALKRRLATLEAALKRNQRQQQRATPEASTEAEEGAALRFRAPGFASLRKRLGLSAQEMGRLIGVTGQTIYAWEAGKSRPRASQLETIARVRKLGKREVAQLLG